MKSQILAIKGLVKCTQCGASCPIEDSFCGKCGAVLEKPEPVVEEEVVEEAEEKADIEIVVAEEVAAEDVAEDTTEE